MMELPHSPVRAVQVKNWCQPFGIEADVLRLDELHPTVSGNKWFKLQPSLQRALDEGKRGLITFGGTWSNHLLATAEACRRAGLEAIGIVRGEQPAQPSAMLQDAEARGMQLHFVSRTTYRSGALPQGLSQEVAAGHYLLVPEGGYGLDGCRGAALIANTVAWSGYTHILTAVGTGTTLAGLTIAALPGQQCIGISVLKNNFDLNASVAALLPLAAKDRFQILHNYHEGGYARHAPALLQFMNEWFDSTGIPSDFVYTGKLFYAADRLVRSGYFAPSARLLLIHSGGLQGNRSLPAGTLIF